MMHRPELPENDLGTLLIRLLIGSIERVWQLAAKGDTDSAQRIFAEQLADPLFIQLDMRHALARRWADKLMAEINWPSGLAEAVFAEFDWEHDAGPCPPELVERYRIRMERSLLARIAKGEVAHDYIDVVAANALLASRIG